MLNLHPPTAGTLAQLVEQRTENPCVPGSIPGGTTQKNQYKRTGFFYNFFSKIDRLRVKRKKNHLVGTSMFVFMKIIDLM